MTDYSKMDIIMSLQFSYSNKRNKDKMFKNNYLETLFKHKGKI